MAMLLQVVFIAFLASHASATRSLLGGGAPLGHFAAGKGGLEALKCSLLAKFGINLSFCDQTGPEEPPQNTTKPIKAAAGSASLVTNTNPGLPIYATTDGTSWAPSNTSVASYPRIAVSKDGTALLAVSGIDILATGSPATVLLSTDAGTTWTAIPSLGFVFGPGTASVFIPLALSRNGSVMLAGNGAGTMYLSSDRGATWVDITSTIAAAEMTVKSSALNTKVPTHSSQASQAAKAALQAFDRLFQRSKAATNGVTTGNSNKGAAATSQASTQQAVPSQIPFEFSAAAVSDDGQTLVVLAKNHNAFVSTDGGATFVSKPSGPLQWSSVAISANGQYIAAATFGTGIYTSSDYGSSWTGTSAAPNDFWTSVTSDNSGQKLAAVALNLTASSGLFVYISSDAGVSWQVTEVGALPAASTFVSVASNGDGSKLLAGAASINFSTTDNYAGAVLESDNGGTSWFKVQDIPETGFFFGLATAEDF